MGTSGSTFYADGSARLKRGGRRGRGEFPGSGLLLPWILCVLRALRVKNSGVWLSWFPIRLNRQIEPQRTQSTRRVSIPIVKRLRGFGDVIILRKPFTPETLLARLAEVLAGPRAA